MFILRSTGVYLCWARTFHTSLGAFQVLSGNIENVSIKEKAKFPQEFFPDVSVLCQTCDSLAWLCNLIGQLWAVYKRVHFVGFLFQFKWSRKGFLRTRWNLCNRQVWTLVGWTLVGWLPWHCRGRAPVSTSFFCSDSHLALVGRVTKTLKAFYVQPCGLKGENRCRSHLFRSEILMFMFGPRDAC